MGNRKATYLGTWIKEVYAIFASEMKRIFLDRGVCIIFFLAGLGYPLLYNFMYCNGTLDEMPIAVVDLADCADSRAYLRKVNDTREVRIKYHCASMEEARRLMEKRKIHGIVLIPSDYAHRLAAGEQATISTYADMSSLLYYKSLTMATNYAMLDEIREIQLERYAAAGTVGEQACQLVEAIPYEENIPYNNAFSYTIFFIPAVLILLIQQTMFYGGTMLAGTMREEGDSPFMLGSGKGAGGVIRVMAGRGLAYFVIYMVLGIYITIITPCVFGQPVNGRFGDLLLLLVFYVLACIMFTFTVSSFFRKRETVFVTLLFLSPVAILLSGFSWPTSAFPWYWRAFSYLFPSTFGIQGYLNVNTAGCDLQMAGPQMMGLSIQIMVYFVLACINLYLEGRQIAKHSRDAE